MEIMVIVRGLWYEVVNQNNSELWDMVLKVKKKKRQQKPPTNFVQIMAPTANCGTNTGFVWPLTFF